MVCDPSAGSGSLIIGSGLWLAALATLLAPFLQPKRSNIVVQTGTAHALASQRDSPLSCICHCHINATVKEAAGQGFFSGSIYFVWVLGALAIFCFLAGIIVGAYSARGARLAAVGASPSSPASALPSKGKGVWSTPALTGK